MPLKPRLRISLRVFFVLVTVGCIWLGLTILRTRERNAAIERIRAIGGTVHFDYQLRAPGTKVIVQRPMSGLWGHTIRPGTVFEVGSDQLHSYRYDVYEPKPPPIPRWMCDWVGDGWFSVVAVVLSRGPLEGFPKLSAPDVQLLRHFPELRVLYLNNGYVNDQTLTDFPNLDRLEFLSLAGASIEGAGLDHLSSLPSLAELDLTHCDLKDESIERARAPASLKIVCLESSDIGDRGLRYLASASQIEEINLNWTPVSGPGLRYLPIDHLKTLELNHTEVADVGLEYIGQSRSLRHLTLSWTSLNDTGLDHLLGLRQLETLEIYEAEFQSTHVSSDAAAAIGTALPETKIQR